MNQKEYILVADTNEREERAPWLLSGHLIHTWAFVTDVAAGTLMQDLTTGRVYLFPISQDDFDAWFEEVKEQQLGVYTGEIPLDRPLIFKKAEGGRVGYEYVNEKQVDCVLTTKVLPTAPSKNRDLDFRVFGEGPIGGRPSKDYPEAPLPFGA